MQLSRASSPYRSFFTIPLLALGLAACADQPALPGSPVAVAPRAATGGAGATLAVTVLTAAGLPAPGLLVVPFNTMTGPFQGGTYTSLYTDSTGLATFTGLSSGSYCVTVRGLPSQAAGFLGGIVPPPAGTAPAVSTTGPVAVVTGAKLATVALTRASFTSYCTTDQAPISLKGGKSVKLTMTLLDPSATPPGSVSWSILGLTGASTNVPAWTVIGLPLPWSGGFNLPPDVRPGLLVATTAQGSNYANGLNTTDSVAVQTTLFQGSAGQGLLTATLHARPQAGGTTASAFVAPLLCIMDTSGESFGDASSGGVDLGGLGPNLEKIKNGWGAYQDLSLNAGTFSLLHSARGTGTITLNIRFVGGPVANISQDFDWNGTAWVKGSTQGSGSGTVDVEPFAALMADGITWRMTWVVTGVDPAVTAADLQLKTSGDQWPDASRQDQVAGFYRLYEPTSSSACTGGNGSDDRFWLN